MNKIADNTFPNVMPMFTGKRMYNEQDDMLKEVEVNKETYFDDWPFIWKLFKAKGYLTAFNEDMPAYGLFHYMTKGFAKEAFDFDYHWFWKLVTPVPFVLSQRCFGNVHRAMVTLDVVRRHVMTLSDKLHFTYSALGELPHDLDNVIELADKDIADFWKEAFEFNRLNKTVIIFFSDHGIRHGTLRRTTIGTYLIVLQ